jgi:TRAP-type C4-dicarboxylate transport system permease small subunit
MKNLLPLGAAVLLLVGAVLILAGVVVQFAGKPELGGQSFWLYEILMGGGAFCMLLGVWFIWRWYKGQPPRQR